MLIFFSFLLLLSFANTCEQINCILLLVILYVIVTKLKHNDAAKNKFIQYKKLTRATLVLFPLFGLTFAVFFWLPTDTKTVFSKVYYFINIFLQTTQGVWVSFIYCFLNDEVSAQVSFPPKKVE